LNANLQPEIPPVDAPTPALDTPYDGADALVLTEFRNLYPRTRVDLTERHLSPEGLAAYLADPPRRPTKEACPLITLARFGDVRSDKGYLRHDANVVALSGIVADYDGEIVSVDETLRMLAKAGIEAYIYTTGRHAAGRPRYRIVVLFAHTYEDTPDALRQLHAQMMARLNGALGGILAQESFTLSQSYYFGRIDGVPFEFGSTEAWIDAHPELWPEVEVERDEEADDDADVRLERRRPLLSFIDELDELDEDAIGKGGERQEAPRADTRTPGEGADDPRERAKLRACLAALVALDAEHDPYELWLAVGMALHHFFAGDPEGLAWWEEWSAQRPKVVGRYTCAQKWETFHAERASGKVVKVATLYRRANQHAPGWRRALGAQVGPVALAVADGVGESSGVRHGGARRRAEAAGPGVAARAAPDDRSGQRGAAGEGVRCRSVRRCRPLARLDGRALAR